MIDAIRATDELLEPGAHRGDPGVIEEADRLRANRVGLEVAIAVAAHQYDKARAAIDRAERGHYSSIARKTNSSRPLDASLIEAGLSIRTANALEEFGIFTVADALACTDADLKAIPNFGPAALAETKACCEHWLGRPRTHVAKNQFVRTA